MVFRLRTQRKRRLTEHVPRTVLWERMEDRLLFDAVADPGLSDAVDLPRDDPFLPEVARDSLGYSAFAESTTEDSSTEQTPIREIVFIDSAIESSDTLLLDLLDRKDVQIVRIDETEDGLLRIAQELESRQSLDAVHVISHGTEGRLVLGGVNLTSELLSSDYRNTLKTIGQSLTDRGDVLFYGCDLAGNLKGREFLDLFSELTGADVAASEDATGHASLGGNWELEIRSGDIDASVIFSQEAQEGFVHLLAVPDVTSSSITVEENSIFNPTNLTQPIDPDLEPLTIEVIELPSEGLITYADGTAIANGTILSPIQLVNVRYQAPTNWSGNDPGELRYSVSDATSTVTGRVDINISEPNATDDFLATPEDTAISGNVMTVNYGLGSDSDPENDALTVIAVNGTTLTSGSTITLASGALLTVAANGDFSYDPNNQFNSLENGATDTDTFTYTIQDETGGTDTATVDVTIQAVTIIDLEVAKRASNTNPAIGQVITWTIDATNDATNATGDATGVVVQDVIPSGQTFVPGSITTTGSGVFDPTTGFWQLIDPLAPGETATLTFDTLVGQSVSTPEFIDLELEIESNATEALTGTQVEFTVTVTNTAEGATVDATGIEVSGLSDGQLSFVTGSETASVGTFDGTTGTWDLGSSALAIGQSATLTYRAIMGAGTATVNAEVSAANETDIDSLPLNFSLNEDDDDEVSVSPTVGNGSRTIVGRAFVDLNNNGIIDGTETGVSDIIVTAYDSSGAVVGSATTTASGDYLFAAPDEDLRLEFTNVPTDMSSGTADSTTADPATVSSIAFIGATGGTTANLALYSPYDDIRLAVTCVIYPGDDGSEGGDDAAVIEHNPDGTFKSVRATIDEVGTTNGLAHSRASNDLFVASFQKRHTDLGPDGNAAIYRIDENNNVTTFIDLDDFFGPDSAGAYSHDNTDFFHDAPAFGTVGKVSLGDIDISEDGQFLYAVNLADRQVYEIPIGSAGDLTPVDYASGDTRTVRTFSILGDDNANPSNGGIALNQLGLQPDQNIRPFALTFRDGLLYVGMVNTAQFDVAGFEGTTTASDMHAYVYTLDPTTGTFSPGPVADFSLDYEREDKHIVAGSANWNPWLDDLIRFEFAPDVNRVVATTQPWLTDIEFDANGDMLLGLRDRTADQFGQKGPGPFDDETNLVVFSAGDTLRALQDGTGGYTLEPHADPGTLASGEFFQGEEFATHQETSQGALATVDGMSVVFSTAMDPNSANSGGVIGLDTGDGTQTSQYELFESAFSLDRTFGKLNGLGDLEYLNNLSLEIGNRVWHDIDFDGIQDAGEENMEGVTLHLYDMSDPANPLMVGTTITDALGEYYFNDSNVTYADGDPIGLRAVTDYQIRVESTDFDAGGSLENFNITLNDQETILQADTRIVSGGTDIDTSGNGLADTARSQRIDILGENSLHSDGKRVVITAMTGGTARVDEEGSVIFNFDPTSIGGTFEYEIIEDRIDSDAIGFDTDGDGFDNEASISFTTGFAGDYDHSLDIGVHGEEIDIAIESVIDRKTGLPGDTVMITYEVTNQGTGNATNVIMENVLPTGLTYTPSSATLSNSGFYNPATGDWTFSDTLAPGETVILTLGATIDAGTEGQALIDTAQITSANGIDIDSVVNNDDGDHSEDEEDDVVVFVGEQSSTTIVNVVQVTSANETDFDSTPESGNPDNDEDDEDIVTIIANDQPTPQISTTKAVVSGPTEQSDGTWNVDFQLILENVGPVDLDNVTLHDDIESQWGNIWLSSSNLIYDPTGVVGGIAPGVNSGWLADPSQSMLDGTGRLDPGDSLRFIYTANFDPDINGPASLLLNQTIATGIGIDEIGGRLTDDDGVALPPVTDLSDDGVDVNGTNPGYPGDTGGTDDPTPVLVPEIGIVKEHGNITANATTPGAYDIEVTLVIQNLGITSLDNLFLSEDLATDWGAAFISATVPIVTPISVTGTTPGVNSIWNTDTTLNMFDGTGLLNRDDKLMVEFVATLDPDVSGTSQPFINQATITARDPDNPNATVEDDSDSGNDLTSTNPDAPGDNNTTDDPTPVIIPDVGLAKQITDIDRVGDQFDLTIELTMENIGTVDLGFLQLFEDIAAQYGGNYVAVLAAPEIIASTATQDPTINLGYATDTTQSMLNDDGLMKPGESVAIEFRVRVEPIDEQPLISLENQARVVGLGLDEDGELLVDGNGTPLDPVDDDSDDGFDPNTNNPESPVDTGGPDDPTLTDIPFVPTPDPPQPPDVEPPTYTFDPFNDMTGDDKQLLTKPDFGHRCDRRLTREIPRLAPDPIFSGSARPGTQIVGRIYDSRGQLIGEELAFADVGGNWIMTFFELEGNDRARIEFEEVVGSVGTFDPRGDAYGYLGYELQDNDYASLEPWTQYDEAYDFAAIFRGSARSALNRMHRLNTEPLGLGQR